MGIKFNTDPKKRSKPMTPLQKIACERNWRVLQIRGAFANAINIAKSLGHFKIADSLEDCKLILLASTRREWLQRRDRIERETDSKKIGGIDKNSRM